MSAAAAENVQQIVQTLLTPNREHFENLLSELMSSDNVRRKFAEQVLDELRKHEVLFVRYLVSTMRHSTTVAYRVFSAVLLRKTVTINALTLWKELPDQVKHEIKNELLAILQNEKNADALYKAADATAEVGRLLLMSFGWPELTVAIFQMLESQSPDAVVAAFRIIGSVADIDESELFTSSAEKLMAALEMGIVRGTVEVKTEAVSALCSIATEGGRIANTLRPLVPKVIDVLIEFLNAQDEQSADSVLQDLIDVVEEEPRFLKKSLKELLDPLLKIAYSETTEISIRTVAVELLLTISEQKDQGLGNLCKIMPNFVQCLFEVLMMFVLDIDDLPEWHGAEEESDDVGKGALFEVGMDALDRLSLAFGGKVLVPIAGAMLSVYVADQCWKKRHGAFICLAQIAEGCEKMMLKEIDALTDMCMSGLDDSSPRVRWAACQAIGQMCTDLAPDIQGTQHGKIIPKLMRAMDDAHHPRVQAHAAAAIVNFCEECEEDDIVPYLDGLVPTVVRLFQSPSKLVTESALTALATAAESVNEHFGPYYDMVMPLLRTMFAQAVDPKLRYLRAKALECISLVGMAVGADCFRQDASEVMQFIHQLHQSHFDPADPLPSYMIQAGARMCRSLKHEFLPYLEIVMPHVLRHLGTDPEIKLADTLTADSDDEDIETFHVGGKIVRVRSSAMEEKATACQMVACYADVLQDGFLPYVKQLTDLVVPLLKFIFNEDVRSAAFQCLPELLDCVLCGMKNNAGVTPDFIQMMVTYMWPAAIDALVNEEELEVQEAGLHAIAAMIDVLNPQLLSGEMVESCFQALAGVFSESEERRKLRIEEAADIDDDDFEEYENVPPINHDDEEQMEADVLDEVATVLSSFMKKYGDGVMPYVVKTMPIVTQLLEKGRSPMEQRIAICIVDDILEHCPQAGNNYLHEFLPFLIESSRSDDANLRQCSVYGLGVVVSKYPEAFQPHLGELLPSLIHAVQHPAARNRGNEMATDNVVSTIGKIIQQFPDKVDAKVVDEVWLKNLPLRHDDLEGKLMHELLVSMVERQDARVLGGSNQNLGHIVEILVQILAAGESMTTPETATRIYTLLQSFSHSMGNEVLSAAVSKMTPKQQKIFHEFSARLNANA